MKNSTLIALSEAGEVPETLRMHWSNKNKRPPIGDALQEIADQKNKRSIAFVLIGIFVMAFTAILLLKSANEWMEMPETVFRHMFLWFLLFAVSSLFGTIIFLCLSFENLLSDFGSQLEKLREVLGLTYGEMTVWKIEDLQERAQKTLYEEANNVRALQGLSGEHSLSSEAEQERAKYKEMHEILFAFGLCEEKGDKYWKTLEQEKREGVAV